MFSLFPELVRHLDVQPLCHLTKIVASLPLDEHTAETLQLSFVLTKRAWKFRAYLESGHSGSRNRSVHKRKRTSRRARRFVKHTNRPSSRPTRLTCRRGSSDSAYSLDSCSSLDEFLLEANSLQLQFGPHLSVVSCQNLSLPSSLLGLNDHAHISPPVSSPVIQGEVSSTTGAVEEEMLNVQQAVTASKHAGSEENMTVHVDDEAGQVGVVTTTNDVPFQGNNSPDGKRFDTSRLIETVTSSQESLVDVGNQQQQDCEQAVDNSWLLGKVCAPGNTLLWDLMHDDMAVS